MLRPPAQIFGPVQKDQPNLTNIKGFVPRSEEEEARQKELFSVFWGGHSFSKTESYLRSMVDDFDGQGANHEVAFTRSMYGALICYIAYLEASIKTAGQIERENRGGDSSAFGRLEMRIAELEARPAFVDRGVWTEGCYEPGNAVTHAGSIWLCKRTTFAKPGTDDTHPDGPSWRLAVRRGRDGRDANGRRGS